MDRLILAQNSLAADVVHVIAPSHAAWRVSTPRTAERSLDVASANQISTRLLANALKAKRSVGFQYPVSSQALNTSSLPGY